MFDYAFSGKEMGMQTNVTVYADDCTGETLLVVCDGTTVEPGGSTWQRALNALAQPSPRGPYPVSNRFTIFVHESISESTGETHVLATYRVDVFCEQDLAHAHVHSTVSCTDFDPLRFSIGDDVVEITRMIFRDAS